MVGPQRRSGRVRKISPPQGFDSRTVHPVGSRYSDTHVEILEENYYPPDSFDVDKTGLDWKKLPQGTFTAHEDQVSRLQKTQRSASQNLGQATTLLK
jgi:hypothetical protein